MGYCELDPETLAIVGGDPGVYSNTSSTPIKKSSYAIRLVKVAKAFCWYRQNRLTRLFEFDHLKSMILRHDPSSINIMRGKETLSLKL
jgi:hypothetical protein